jgi:hypothetical protein
VQKEIESKIQQLKGWSDKAHRESRRKAQGRMGAKEYYRKKAKKRDQAVKSQIKRLEKMRQEGTSRPEKEVQVSFGLKAWEQGGKRLLEGQDVGKSFGELLLFKDSSFYIKRGENIKSCRRHWSPTAFHPYKTSRKVYFRNFPIIAIRNKCSGHSRTMARIPILTQTCRYLFRPENTCACSFSHSLSLS